MKCLSLLILLMLSNVVIANEVDWIEESINTYVNSEVANFENDNIYEWLDKKIELNEEKGDCAFSYITGLAEFNSDDDYLAIRERFLSINTAARNKESDLFYTQLVIADEALDSPGVVLSSKEIKTFFIVSDGNKVYKSKIIYNSIELDDYGCFQIDKSKTLSSIERQIHEYKKDYSSKGCFGNKKENVLPQEFLKLKESLID